MKSKTSSYIKQTLGQIRNPVPSLLSMIAKHPILVKDTHIQNYFPDKMYYFPNYFPDKMYYFPDKNYFPNYFPSHFSRFFGVQKSEQLLFSQKLLLIFKINLNTQSVPPFVLFSRLLDKSRLFSEFGTESVPFFNFSPLITF